jgi:hypothetical protein
MQEGIEQNALELLQAIREHHPDIYAGAAWVNSESLHSSAGGPAGPLARAVERRDPHRLRAPSGHSYLKSRDSVLGMPIESVSAR